MMIDKIIKILKTRKEIDDWKIVQNDDDAQELFFIRKALDMNRAKSTQKFFVTLYHDFEENDQKYRGSSTSIIYPTMKSDEIEETVNDALFSSKFVKNSPYPLAKPSKMEGHFTSSKYSSGDLSEWIHKISEELYSADRFMNSWINSSELFLKRNKFRVINSKGVDVSWELYKLYIEFITTSKRKGEEVELYSIIENSDFENGEIYEKVSQALEITEERANAISMPAVKGLPVLLSGEAVGEFLKYYLYKSSARYFYEHLSTAKTGDTIQGDDPSGDRITMYIDPSVNGSSYSTPYDEDGLPLRKVKIIENGIMKRYWGELKYAYYLKVKPTGQLTNFTVNGGKISEASLQEGRYLKLLSFSDFQSDPMTGDFGGEVRLGWYNDGESTVPVSGGSISGNISEVQSNMIFSKEIQKDKNFVVPKMIKLSNVKISAG
uniref:TldD/PmbA family protein n=1 Tax=Mesoaciditoga lauensis TaxID=1495039 RepID=A0A7V3RDS3_9BACT